MASYTVSYTSIQGGVASPANALFIDESPVADDLFQVKVDSVPGGQPITIQGKESASPQNYHFTVFFNLGDLSHPDGIVLAADQVNDWAIDVEADPGSGTMIYVVRKTTVTLSPGSSSAVVTLQKVGAAPETGPRVTHVAFTWADDIAQKDPNGLGQLSPPVQIMNRERKTVPPLSVGFDTTNMVLSDGNYPNVLMLRIVNLSTFPIRLDPDQCKLTLTFDTSTDENQLWALTTPSRARSFHLPGKLDSSGRDDGWPGYGAWDVKPVDDPVEWHLTPTTTNTALAAGSSLEIPISNIVTGHPTGRSLLRVQYQGFQEYDDGEFTVEIQKAPLRYSQVDSALQIRGRSLGLSHSNHGTELRTFVEESGAIMGTFSSHPLQLCTDSKPRITLTTDGKLGIGTSEPEVRLDVGGDVAISWDLAVGGDASVTGKLAVQGDLSVNGNFMINGQPPMVVKTFSGQGYTVMIETGYSSKDWYACIAGFYTRDGNITHGILHWHDNDQNWMLIPYGQGPDDMEWSIPVLFVRKELCTW